MDFILYFLYICLLIKVLIFHEVGHYLAMHRHGIALEGFGLGIGPTILRIGKFQVKAVPFGAFVLPNSYQWETASPRTRLDVALAGSVTNLTVALIFYAISLIYPQYSGLKYLGLMHATVGLFNLLPVPPLDGWLIVKELFNLSGKPLSERTLGIANRVANGLIYGVGFFFITYWTFIPHQ